MEAGVVRAGRQGAAGEAGPDNGPDILGTAAGNRGDGYPCVEVAVRVGEFWDLPRALRGDATQRRSGSGTRHDATGVGGSGFGVAASVPPPVVVDLAALGFGTEPGRSAGPVGVRDGARRLVGGAEDVFGVVDGRAAGSGSVSGPENRVSVAGGLAGSAVVGPRGAGSVGAEPAELAATGRRAARPAAAGPANGTEGGRPPRRARRPAVKIIDVGSPEYATVWEPMIGRHREPRPGLLTSVVRAGTMIACPPPLFETVIGRPALPVRGAERSPAAAKTQPSDEATSQQAYVQVRALVGALVDVLAARRSTDQVTAFLAPTVRQALRSPDRARFAPTATLRRVRLATAGNAADLGIEATALVQDGARLRAIAFRFDRTAPAEESPPARGTRTRRPPDWLCTALQVA